MVSAILLRYVIDDPLPIRGTFGDPGSNPDADNFFFWSLLFFFFFHMLSSFHMLLIHKLLLYLVCTVASVRAVGAGAAGEAIASPLFDQIGQVLNVLIVKSN